MGLGSKDGIIAPSSGEYGKAGEDWELPFLTWLCEDRLSSQKFSIREWKRNYGCGRIRVKQILGAVAAGL